MKTGKDSPSPNGSLCILDDICVDTDEFVEATHEALAEKIYTLIANTSGSGYSIGLEGKWGAGKSTVVSILRTKLKENQAAFPFYIDAWEHEGDSLRRMFLVSLIQQLLDNESIHDKCGKELEKTRKKVNSKQSTVTATQKTSLSGFGKFAAALALLIPFGTVLVEKTLDEVTFGIGLPIHRRFCLGLALMLAPFFAYPLQGIHWVFSWMYSWARRKIQNKQNDDDTKGEMPSFAWFDAKSELQTTNATTEETEKDSVVFADLFSSILKCVKGKVAKLVIIVDNLDRINHQDALKIWSTLQTFVRAKEKMTDVKLWVIIPYTEEGIKALWENEKDKQEDKPKDKPENKPGDINVGKSFLDKNFQLRFEVPDLLIGDWQAFARKKMEDIFADFSEADRKLILDMLCWARRNSADAPSPREIKLYLNQVKLLHSIHSPAGVSLAAICFYATLRFVCGISRSQIESDLRNAKITTHSLPLHSDNVHLVEDICAILYHVPRDKGIQILLEGQIQEGLGFGKEAKLESLFQAHGEAFAGVLGHILSHAPDTAAFEYALAVQKGLASESEIFHNMAISHWRDWFSNLREDMPGAMDHELIAQFGAVVSSDGQLAHDTWDYFVSAFRNSMLGQNCPPHLWLMYLRDARSAYGFNVQIEYSENMLPLLKQCGALDIGDQHDFASFLRLPSSVDEQIANEVKAGRDLDENLPVAFSVLIKAGMQSFAKTFEELQKSFANQGPKSDKHYQMIACIDCIENKEKRTNFVREFLKKAPAWDAMLNSRSSYPKNILAYLIPKYLGTMSPSKISSEIQIRQDVVANIVNRWKSSSASDAESIYQLTSASGDYSYLGMLSETTENKLVREVVRCAIHNKDLRIAKGEDVFVRFAKLLKFVSPEDKTPYSSLFVEADDIVLELENATPSTMMSELSALQFLTDNMSEDEFSRIRSGLEKAFAAATPEEWKISFINPSAVVKLFEKLKEDNSTLSLTNAFCEAFKEWLASLFEAKENEEVKNFNDIDTLSHFLAKGFKEEIAVHINQLARQKSFSLRPFEAELVLRFGAHNKWTEEDGERICTSMQKAILNKDGKTLPLLIPILNKGLDKFKPSDRFSSTLKEPVETWFKDASEEDRKNLSAICSSLHILLDPPPPSCDNPKP